MAAIKAGQRVRVTTREVSSEDERTGLYFEFMGGLTGTVERLYDDDSACVDVDIESLPEEARSRHEEMEEHERKRWLDNLSGEVRNRLTPEQRTLTMSYRILASKKDLEPIAGGAPKKKADKGETESEESPASRKGQARTPEPEAIDASASPPENDEADEQTTSRLSEADLSAAEEAFLKSLKKRSE